MIWQDYVISVGQFIFALAVVPSLRSQSKPAFSTSLITAMGLSVFAFCFLTLHLTLSTLGTASTALAWWLLVYQTARREPVKHRLDRARIRSTLDRRKANLCDCLLECDLSLSEILHTGELPNGMQCRVDVAAQQVTEQMEDELINGTDPDGPEPRGIFTVGDELTPADVERVREHWTSQYAGPANAHRPVDFSSLGGLMHRHGDSGEAASYHSHIGGDEEHEHRTD